MEKSNFDDLLKRYITGELSEHEKAKLEAWLDVMKTKNRDNLELSEEDEEKLFQKIVSRHDNLAEIRTMLPERNRPSWIGWTIRIAASIFVVSLVTYFAWNFGKEHSAVVEVASHGQVEKVLLPDNSLVWLKGNSKLIYYEKEDDKIRYAELTGEALFEVTKDPSHPFVINCGDATLKVLGTSFSVRASNDSIQLTVLTGKVNITMAKNGDDVDVLPHEKVILPRNGKIEKVALANDEVSLITSGTEYNLDFNNVSLNDITTQLERKFNTSISIEDAGTSACRITIDLTDQSLERSLEMISETLNVELRRQGDLIIVGGQGCSK